MTKHNEITKRQFEEYLKALDLKWAKPENKRVITSNERVPVLEDFPGEDYLKDRFFRPRLALRVFGVDIYAAYAGGYCQSDETNYWFTTGREPDEYEEGIFGVRDLRLDLNLESVLIDHCIHDGKYLHYEKWMDVIRPIIFEGIIKGYVKKPERTPWLVAINNLLLEEK